MTLVLAITARDTIWLAADRRLSAGKAVVTNQARKVVGLETTDGIALLGYAGLGRTAGGTEPSDWINRVLRGRNWPLEAALGALSDALQKEMPRHLHPRQLRSHHIIVPAFVGRQSRLYSVELALAPDDKSTSYRYTRWVGEERRARVAPRLTLAGSGGSYLEPRTDWQRNLLRLVKGHDRGRVPALIVADKIAELNFRVSANDPTVGPNCIVAWKYRKEGPRKGGGGSQYYTGTNRVMAESFERSVPQIANGMDVMALVTASMPHFQLMMRSVRDGLPAPEVDPDQINAALAKLPHGPEDELN